MGVQGCREQGPRAQDQQDSRLSVGSSPHTPSLDVQLPFTLSGALEPALPGHRARSPSWKHLVPVTGRGTLVWLMKGVHRFPQQVHHRGSS